MHITAVLLLCCALLCGSAVVAAPKSSSPKPKASSSVPPDVAALVNGEPIPERIVQSFIKNGQEALAINPGTEEGAKKLAQLRENIIDEQIGRFLIAQEAARRKIAPTDAEIDEVENRTLESMGGSEERYAEFLRKNNFSREDYRRYVVRSELCGKAMAAALGEGITVTDEEVKAYYETHKSDADFQWPERVTAAHILLDTRRGVLNERVKKEKQLADGPELQKAVDAEIERRQKLAEEVRTEALQPGADFGALAQKYSDDFGSRSKGGSLGTAARGARPKEFDDVAFSLQPGEIGPVVQTEFGFHVLKVLDHRPAETRPFEVQEAEIRRRLMRERQTKKMREWLQAARSKAKVVLARGSDEPPTATPRS